ncbi:MAG: 5-dehydro-2-deoxygluconokinase [Acidobacteria bacterium]|nr:MAG: 5-dehydro-2-deoxygluconokinase [Acidobacteriota bacterium]
MNRTGNLMDVCVLGRIGYDLHAVERNQPLAEVKHFSRHLGGSSANIAVGLARLGLGVGIISSVGKDALADFLLGFLKNEGIDTRFVRLVEGYNTSLCLTEVSPPDHFPQVFYRRDPADVHLQVGRAELAYIQGASLFVTNGTSLSASPAREATISALKAARVAGLRTAFDMDYRPSSWQSPAQAGAEARKALPWVDVLLGNEDELCLLSGEREARAQAQVGLDAGVGLVIRKRGSEGVEAYSREGYVFAPKCPVQVASTIGAGDGFAAGFLYGLVRGFSLDDCLRYGNAVAAIVVSRISCSDALPYLKELKELLALAPGLQ